MGWRALLSGLDRRHGVALAAGLAVALAVPLARSAGLVADLSHHLVAITTAFSGTEVLLFGALETPGSEVAVVVRGPDREETVRRKGRVGFLWLNTRALMFRGVPLYYAVGSSRPLDDLAPAGELARYQIGLGNLRLDPERGQDASPQAVADFRQGLVRNRLASGLYSERVAKVSFLGDRLFRTTVDFPANVRPGSYQVRVFELKEGRVVGAQNSTLVISRIGLEADIFSVAHENTAVYGLASILLALVAGWVANAIFQRR